jgi:putative ABC transport system permease protein
MALGLVVGVAALGVISARAVVERRQQIAVLRAIGFRRAMSRRRSCSNRRSSRSPRSPSARPWACCSLRDSQKQPSWDNLTLVVPWAGLAVIFVAVYAVALLATLVPAVRASRTRPSEALRYQ